MIGYRVPDDALRDHLEVVVRSIALVPGVFEELEGAVLASVDGPQHDARDFDSLDLLRYLLSRKCHFANTRGELGHGVLERIDMCPQSNPTLCHLAVTNHNHPLVEV